jgi:hypothetical protein
MANHGKHMKKNTQSNRVCQTESAEKPQIDCKPLQKNETHRANTWQTEGREMASAWQINGKLLQNLSRNTQNRANMRQTQGREMANALQINCKPWKTHERQRANTRRPQGRELANAWLIKCKPWQQKKNTQSKHMANIGPRHGKFLATHWQTIQK